MKFTWSWLRMTVPLKAGTPYPRAPGPCLFQGNGSWQQQGLQVTVLKERGVLPLDY